MHSRFSYAIAVLLLGASSIAAHAQSYPTRPIRFLVPAPPGGTGDLLIRLVGAKLAAQVNQQVIVDNRSGAGGVVAMELLARSTPDGYTIGMAYTSLTTGVSLHSKLPYAPVSDFTALTQLTSSPLVLVVHPGSAIKSVKDMVAQSKAKPLSYGSAGNGSGGHLSGELLKLMTGLAAAHVPYKGAGPAAIAVAAGEVDFQFGAQITVEALVKSGRLRAVAVSSLTRAASLPDLPTVAESGVPGYEVINWFGVLAPARLPPVLVVRLHAELVRALNVPDVRDKLVAMGSQIIGSTPQQFATFIRDDIPKWAKVVKAAGMKVD